MKREPYTVVCDACRGKMFDDSMTLCGKCFGDGRILITETEERRTVRKALDDVFAAGRALGRAVGLR